MDYKDGIQLIYDQMCAEEYNCDYWELDPKTQERLYRLAQQKYYDMQADRADYLRKQERENP